MPARLPRPASARCAAAMLAACLVLAGCNPGATGVSPSASAAPGARKSPAARASTSPAPTPVVGPADLAEVQLAGVVRLIANHGGGIISDNGGSIISNNTGGIISDNGGGLISDAGGSVVSNNGAQYELAQAGKAAESLLADAKIAFLDAAGAPLMGPDGKPLEAVTDKRGRYALRTALGPGNLVMKVKLWNGGELSALLVHDGKAGGSQDVDTATSLGAAFVLDRYVKGDQAVLNKLPAGEAQRLRQELDAARAQLAAAPAYTTPALVAAAEDLRGKVPAVAKTLEAIRELLLGQEKLGDGRPATEVPLNRPTALGFDAAGRLVIAEYGMGRVRVVDAEGRMNTLVDATRGTVKTNFVRLQDQIMAPDGTLYFATLEQGRVVRVRPDGRTETVYEDGVAARYHSLTLALGPDGTLYVGGGDEKKGGPWTPRVVAIAPDGTKRELPLPDATGLVRGLAVGTDGALWVLRSGPHDAPTPGTLHRLPPGGAPQLLAADLHVMGRSDVALGPDGKLYVSGDEGGRLHVFAADGTRAALEGPGGKGAIQTPSGVAVAADGRVYVSDQGAGQVRMRRPDGTWSLVAGVDGDALAGDGRALPLNTPVAVAFDAQGRLLIVENGRNRVVRFADGKLETIAGTVEGYAGDGGPATAARFDGLTGLATRGSEILVLDTSNNRLRRIGADGLVTTIAGPGAGHRARLDGPVPATDANVALAMALALDPDGRPYWSNSGRHQVHRLGTPSRVDPVAGRKLAGDEGGLAALLADMITDGEPAATAVVRFPLGLAFKGGDLYVADTGHGLVRKVTGLGGADPRIETVVGLPLVEAAVLAGDPARLGRDGAARDVVLASPAGLCFDAAGNMYVGEIGTTSTDLMADVFPEGAALDLSGLPPIPPRVRKVTPDGQVTTIVGPGGRFATDPNGDDALVMPLALAVRPDGALVIADPGANVVRILPAGSY